MNRAHWLLTAALALLLVLTTCGSRRALASADARVDSLRTETLAARASAMGWETRFAGTTEALARQLQERRDSLVLLSQEKADLAREVELLGGRLESMVDLYASAVGTIEAHDAVVHRSDLIGSDPSGGQLVDSITGHVSDGLLSADVKATVEPPTVSIPSYSVELALALGWTVGADGRALATAMPLDPRVTLRIGEAWYSPPPPVNYCGWGTRAKWALGGAAVGGAVGFGGGVAIGGLP